MEFGRDRFSGIYAELCKEITVDEQMLSLATAVLQRGLEPYSCLAAIQYVVSSSGSGLLRSTFFDTNIEIENFDKFYSVLREFCLDHGDLIRHILRTRIVQTNEVGRSVFILVALDAIRRWFPNSDVGMLEVGSSAGLLLDWDKYCIVLGDDDGIGAAKVFGAKNSDVILRCGLRDAVQYEYTPDILVDRRGLDMHPVDLKSADQRHWLQCCIPPDQPERKQRLRAALAQPKSGWTVQKGNAVNDLQHLGANHVGGELLFVVQFFVSESWTRREMVRYSQALRACASNRPVVLAALEQQGPNTVLELTAFCGNRGKSQRKAWLCHPQGDWVAQIE